MGVSRGTKFHLLNPQSYLFDCLIRLGFGVHNHFRFNGRESTVAVKQALLMLLMVGLVGAYNVSVRPNLSDANNLLLNESVGTLNGIQSDSSAIVGNLVIVFYVVFFLGLVYILVHLLGGGTK
jgi:hypothetical protein